MAGFNFTKRSFHLLYPSYGDNYPIIRRIGNEPMKKGGSGHARIGE